MKASKLVTLLILVILFIFGCSEQTSVPPTTVSEETTALEPKSEPKPEPPDYLGQGVNEAGKIMVLEYHLIGEKEDRWQRTASNFRNDLQRLYDAGFRLVSVTDLLTNNINVPLGYSPVVLTFDDGTKGHFRYLDAEKQIIDPDCAVGILQEFSKKHPDFGFAATFYVYYPTPFEEKELWQQKVKHLIDLGLEIGNHTNSHANLSKLNDEQAQMELAFPQQRISEIVSDYQINSLALPFGIFPKNQIIAQQGNYNGVNYNHLGVFLVGANPTYPMGHIKFDPLKIPRIQAIQTELDKWIVYFENHPEQRYISDGNTDTVVVPKESLNQLDSSRLKSKNLISY